MTRLDFNAFRTRELTYELRSLTKLVASGRLADQSAHNQHHETLNLQAELEKRGGRDIAAASLTELARG